MKVGKALVYTAVVAGSLYVGDRINLGAKIMDAVTIDTGEAALRLQKKIAAETNISKYANELSDIAYTAIDVLPEQKQESTIVAIVESFDDSSKDRVFRDIGDAASYGCVSSFVKGNIGRLDLKDQEDVFEITGKNIYAEKKEMVRKFFEDKKNAVNEYFRDLQNRWNSLFSGGDKQ